MQINLLNSALTGCARLQTTALALTKTQKVAIGALATSIIVLPCANFLRTYLVCKFLQRGEEQKNEWANQKEYPKFIEDSYNPLINLGDFLDYYKIDDVNFQNSVTACKTKLENVYKVLDPKFEAVQEALKEDVAETGLLHQKDGFDKEDVTCLSEPKNRCNLSAFATTLVDAHQNLKPKNERRAYFLKFWTQHEWQTFKWETAELKADPPFQAAAKAFNAQMQGLTEEVNTLRDHIDRISKTTPSIKAPLEAALRDLGFWKYRWS